MFWSIELIDFFDWLLLFEDLPLALLLIMFFLLLLLPCEFIEDCSENSCSSCCTRYLMNAVKYCW